MNKVSNLLLACLVAVASVLLNPIPSRSQTASIARGTNSSASTVVRLVADLPDYSGPSEFRGRPALVAVSPDGGLTAVSAGGRTVKVFETQSGLLRFTLKAEKGINGFAFSPDGQMLATRDLGDKSVRLWDASTGKERLLLTGRKRDIETKVKAGIVVEEFVTVPFSPDGQTVISEREDDIISLWNVDTGTERIKLEHDTQGNAARDILKRVLSLGPGDSLLPRAQFSQDGRRIVTTNGDNRPKLWDASTGSLVATLAAHTDRVYAATFSPDGKTIGTLGFDGAAHMWDAETGQLKSTLRGKAKGYFKFGAGLGFSPDGRSAVSFRNNETTIWDVETGEVRFKLGKGTAKVAIFNPDAQTLVTAGDDKRSTATFWDLASGKLKFSLPGPDDSTDFAAFSPDGRILVTTSDKGVKLWDAVDGRLLTTLNRARYPISFSKDGRYLVTGGTNSTARLFALTPAEAAH